MGLSLRGSVALPPALIAIAVFLDYGDGLIARAHKGANELGKQLDSLADMLSFGGAPVVYALSQQNNLLTVAACIVYAGAGAVRLARFNLQREKRVYYGIPIPAAALAAAAVALFAPAYAWASMLVLAAFMVSGLRIRKTVL
jgi:CDP-diacylglycerol--serine O-phosphatidyltransferase